MAPGGWGGGQKYLAWGHHLGEVIQGPLPAIHSWVLDVILVYMSCTMWSQGKPLI